MFNIWSSDRRFLGLLVLGTIISRLPLINYGFGAHSDTWRVGITAYRLFYYGEYFPSRSTGYPIPEFFSAALIPFGSFGTNFGSLLAGICSIVLFFKLLKHYDIDYQYYLTTTFAFLPLIWIHSSATIDYIYALAFGLGSWYLLAINRELLAGVVFGLTVASRPQFATLGLPLLYLLYRSGQPKKRIIQTFTLSGLVAAPPYLPVINTYGINRMLGLSGEASAGNALLQTLNWTFTQWIMNVGFYFAKWIGLTQISVLTIIIIWKGLDSIWHRRTDTIEVAMILWIVPPVAFFLLFPNKGGYLISALPAVLILLGKYVSKEIILTGICILLILNNIVTPSLGVIVGEPQGTFERNLQNRQTKVAASEYIIDSVISGTQNGTTLIIAGGFQSSLQYELLERCHTEAKSLCDRIKIVGFLPKSEINAKNVYYTPQAAYQTQDNLSKIGKPITYEGNFTYQYTPYKSRFGTR